MMPAPSPKTVPLAFASKLRLCPSGDSKPLLSYMSPDCCGTRREMPPAKAMSHSPAKILWHARCVATREVEQNVCTQKLGPLRFNLYEMAVVKESLSLASAVSGRSKKAAASGFA